MSSCAARSWAFVLALLLAGGLFSLWERARGRAGDDGARGRTAEVLRYNRAPWG